jgi:hypothetical protein
LPVHYGTVAPLAASGVAWALALFVPGYQPRAFAFRQFTTVYTELGAAAAGLVVALLVGGAIWLAMRPASRGPESAYTPNS